MENYVQFKDVGLVYGITTVLENINLTIPQGSTTMVVGPSGCGKTSILNFITGKIKPTQGTVIVDNIEVNNLKNSASYRKNIGMLFQKSGLFPDMTVAENVALPFYEHFPELTKEQIELAVKLKLNAVGLRGVYDKYPSQLSGGMERRVALARAVALDPSLILYDEPLTGQDPISCGVLISLMKALKEAYGATSIIVTHQISTLAKHVDRVCVVGDKTVLLNNTVENTFASKEPYINQFIAGVPDGVVKFHHAARPLEQDLNIGDAND